jgi:hypothetical protein
MPTGLAPVDVLKPPLRSMKVLCDELLGWCRHGHIQWREALVGMPSEHGEPAMGAGVGWGQDLAEGVHHRPRLLRQGRVR